MRPYTVLVRAEMVSGKHQANVFGKHPAFSRSWSRLRCIMVLSQILPRFFLSFWESAMPLSEMHSMSWKQQETRQASLPMPNPAKLLRYIDTWTQPPSQMEIG